ncbi:MAG: OsmC family protein [Bacteroidales bacterium]|nr:OsmC family protein [Bacteroidales bacterium]
MATSEIIYLGNLRTEAIHLASGTKITTDAPKDNKGKGEFFSPTDLVATAFASCMLTIMGIAADSFNYNIDGATAQVTKIMSANPRKIAEIHVDIHFPNLNYTKKQKQVISQIVSNCPVSLSLSNDIKKIIKLKFNDEIFEIQ